MAKAKLIAEQDLRMFCKNKAISPDKILPEIIRDLLIASGVARDKIEIPGTRIHGFDIIVDEAPSGLEFVPQGRSVFEVSVEGRPGQKADRDYAERQVTDRGFRKETTYIALSAQGWRDAAIWAATKKDEKAWRDVRAINSSRLADWLNAAPGVALSYASELGIAAEGHLACLDDAWARWARATRHPVTNVPTPVTKELLLCQRDKELHLLDNALAAGHGGIAIEADSPDEGFGFALAAVRHSLDRATPSNGGHSDCQVVVASDGFAAASLHEALSGLFIIVANPSAHDLRSLAAKHVIVTPLTHDREAPTVISLTRPSIYEFARALQAAGFTDPTSNTSAGQVADAKAEVLARELGASTTILRRLLALDSVPKPIWRQEIVSRPIVRAGLIAGRWKESEEGDKEVISVLTGVEYAIAKPEFNKSLSEPDPPFERIEGTRMTSERGSHWFTRSPIDAFEAWGPTVDQDLLDRIAQAVRMVFVPTYQSRLTQPASGHLRDGLAETLLLLAVRGPKISNLDALDPRLFVDGLIQELVALASHRNFLQALGAELPEILEAAPGPLLSALDRLIEGAEKHDEESKVAIAALFSEAALDGPMHTHLLWALERLAWLPEYLAKVANILARLARIDPGGRLSNRPQHSLEQIFLCWVPQTDATLAERESAIDGVLEAVPEIGWQLLMRLMPLDHDTGGYHSRPKMRASERRSPVTRREVYLGYDGIVRRVVRRAEADPLKWAEILESGSALSDPEWRSLIVDRLTAVTEELMHDKSATLQLWTSIDAELRRHRHFAKAEWRWNDSTLTALDKIAERIRPTDKLAAVKWLFDDWTPDIETDDEPVETAMKRLADKRKVAIQSLLDDSNVGIAGIVTLAREAKLPRFIAEALAGIAQERNALSILQQALLTAIDESESSNALAEFSSEISRQAFSRFPDWPLSIGEQIRRAEWPIARVALVVQGWPPGAALQKILRDIGQEAENAYWEKAHPWGIKDFAVDGLVVIEELLKHARPNAALNVVVLDKERTLSPTVIWRIIDQIIASHEQAMEDTRRLDGGDSYRLEQTLKHLASLSEHDRTRVADVEEKLFDVMQYGHAGQIALFDLIGKYPLRFVGYLCQGYRASNEAKVELEGDELRSAKRAWHILWKWRRLPGEGPDEAFDPAHLHNWIQTLLAEASTRGRRDIALDQVGKVLAQGKQQPDARDGAWPRQEVRDELERLTAKEVGNGFVVACFNRRGVFSKSAYEGGMQERDLSTMYRRWADICAKGGWERTSRLLGQMAERYKSDAEQEDQRVRIEKRRGG